MWFILHIGLTVGGAWLGAVVLPLDWNTYWQVSYCFIIIIVVDLVVPHHIIKYYFASRNFHSRVVLELSVVV